MRCPRNKWGCLCQTGGNPDVGFQIGEFISWPHSDKGPLSLWQIEEIHVPRSLGTIPTLWSRCWAGRGTYEDRVGDFTGGFFPQDVRSVGNPAEVYLALGGDNAMELLALASL